MKNKPIENKRGINWRKLTFFAALVIVPVFFVLGLNARWDQSARFGLGGVDAPVKGLSAVSRLWEGSLSPRHLARPYGMAPVAWQAFLRACREAKIHPDRIGQTIGDDERSVGYHHRDGVVVSDGQRIDYCAALDIGVPDLDAGRRDLFLRCLYKQGFAAWYRSGPNWKNDEHIHAIYAFLGMKPQLREQVHQFLRERREAGRPPRWEIKLRRTRKQRRDSA
jgi:hypothetical protein